MPGFKLETHINRPPEEVFAFAANLENLPRWLPQIRQVEKLTDGPIRPGTVFRETRQFGRRTAQADIEIVVHEPPLRHSARGRFPGGEAVYHYTFTPDEGGTRVEMVADVRGGWGSVLLIPLLVRTMQQQDGDQLERLKMAMETLPPAAE